MSADARVRADDVGVLGPLTDSLRTGVDKPGNRSAEGTRPRCGHRRRGTPSEERIAGKIVVNEFITPGRHDRRADIHLRLPLHRTHERGHWPTDRQLRGHPVRSQHPGGVGPSVVGPRHGRRSGCALLQQHPRIRCLGHARQRRELDQLEPAWGTRRRRRPSSQGPGGWQNLRLRAPSCGQ